MLLVDAALKHPKQVVRYDDTKDDEMSCVEEPDDDAEMSDEDTETDSLLAQKLHKVWKSQSPPNHKETLLRSWYVIYEQRKKILFITKLLNRFLHDKAGPVQSFQMKCFKPKCGSGNILKNTPQHLPDYVDNFYLSDIIAGPLTVIPKGSQNFEILNYEQVVELFNQARLIAKFSKYVYTILAICSS